MCQTSSLIFQTKAGEFDLSEFRSFVPMNKTSPLLDVTRTYQVTDSPFELGGDSAGTLRGMKQKRWSFYCISSAEAARRDNLTNVKTHRYVQNMNVIKKTDFWSVFLMNNTLRRAREEKTERQKKVDLRFHLSVITTCANSFNCAKIKCRD